MLNFDNAFYALTMIQQFKKVIMKAIVKNKTSAYKRNIRNSIVIIY